MKRVLILVEGFTEERLVKDVLYEHLFPKGLVVIPKIAATKRVKNGPDFKGGVTDYLKVERDLKRLLSDTSAVFVTTFIDYYGLPHDFPGMASRTGRMALERAKHVEVEWGRRINHSRFHAHLMVHEFEAMLFAKPDELGKAFNNISVFNPLSRIRSEFPTPEEINDNPTTAPSKRIQQLLPGYEKSVYGSLLIKRIGLELIRKECHHFNERLTWLESI
jgi:hypothetical protein